MADCSSLAMGKAARRKHPQRLARVAPTAAASPGSGSLTGAAPFPLAVRARRAAEAGATDLAIGLYAQVVQQGSTSPDVFNDLGALMAARGQLPAAVVQFEIALVFAPRHADARLNLMKALETLSIDAFRARRWPDAAAGYQRLCALDSDSGIFHNNAGAALRELGHPGAALQHLERARALDPRNPTVHYNLGSALFDLGRADSEAALQRALEIDPSYVDAHVNLALVQDRLGRLTQAVTSLERALCLAPDHADAHGNLASLLRERGELDAAMDHFRRALELRPDAPKIFSGFLLARHGESAATPSALLAEHRTWAQRFAAQHDPGERNHFEGRVVVDPERRLRVGYVSADFRSHSVASFIEPLLASHDRTAVEVICYSDAIPDQVTDRIRTVARPDLWVETRTMGDGELAARIGQDQIDVLVDLAGHTAGNRLLCFARRPAPVQVSYCGYPATTGLPAMGWRLTDATADPEEEGGAHTVERLWRLPHGFLCFRPDPGADEPSLSPATARGAATFGSFNNLAKIGPEVLALWAVILRETPGSRILLKARALSDEGCGRRLRETFARLGVEGERVEIAPYSPTPREHLALYARVDIGLDPFPYNGTTTTCEALWMGVPVVTMRGHAHAGRVGASILGQVGGDAWIADTADEYLKIAVGLAMDRPALARLRSGLRARVAASPLTDAPVIAHDIETAYRHMWRRWCASRPPVAR